MRLSLSWMLPAFAWVAFAGGTQCSCGSEGSAVGAAAKGKADAAAEGGDSDTAELPRGGVDCQHAVVLEMGKSVKGLIDPPGRADYFTLHIPKDDFAGANDMFVDLSTKANSNDDPDKLDTVISIVDENNQPLATNDDAIPRVSTDSQLFYHTPTDATLCIKVEDYSAWKGKDLRGGPMFTFELFAARLSNAQLGVNVDREPNDELSRPQPIGYGMWTDGIESARLFGKLDPQTDVDIYAFVMPDYTVSADFYFAPAGPSGNGATTSPGLVRVTDLDGNGLAQLNWSKGALGIMLPLDPGTEALLWVPRPANTPLGSNDFYFLSHQPCPQEMENLPEKESSSAANNTLKTAEEMPTREEGDVTPEYTHRSILGSIAPVSDVDYYKFPAKNGDSLDLGCRAQRRGSGLLGLTVSLQNSAGQEIQTETETDAEDLAWSDFADIDPSRPAVKIPANGDYYLRLSATGQTDGVSSSFYRCDVTTHPVPTDAGH